MSPPLPPLSEIDRVIAQALDEDRARADCTTPLVVAPEARGAIAIVAKAEGVAGGLPLVPRVFGALDATFAWTAAVPEGAPLAPGTALGRGEGALGALLAGERTALNLLARLSGIASLTTRFVRAVAGTRARILDTRKTTPGLRALEKYAVAVGGGTNHRADLADAPMLKDNHFAAARAGRGWDFRTTLARALAAVADPARTIVEVETLDQLAVALDFPVGVILLDNFSVADTRAAVARRDAAARARADAHRCSVTGDQGTGEGTGRRSPDPGHRPPDPAPRPLLESSGGITLRTVRRYAETGVDRISVGALTHSAPALDLAARIEALAQP